MIEIHFVSTKCFINTSYAERLQLRASYSIWISVYPGHTGLCSICKYFMFHTLIYRSPCSHGCWLGSCLLGRLRNQDKPGLVLSNRWFANSPTKLPFLCVFFSCSEATIKLPLWLITDHRSGRFMGGCSLLRKAHALHLALWTHQPVISQVATFPTSPLLPKPGAK